MAVKSHLGQRGREAGEELGKERWRKGDNIRGWKDKEFTYSEKKRREKN